MADGYHAIVAAVDAEFERNRRLHGDRIRCGAGCSDCCYQQFYITGMDAQRIREGLRNLDAEEQAVLGGRALRYMEQLAAGATRLPCPALDEGRCTIYEHRPLICRKFGMPIYDPDRPDRVFACELNFGEGEEIRDPDLVRIQTGIHERWKGLQIEMHDSGPTTIARTIVDGTE